MGLVVKTRGNAADFRGRREARRRGGILRHENTEGNLGDRVDREEGSTAEPVDVWLIFSSVRDWL